PIYDSGVSVGEIEITRSVSEVATWSLAVLALSATLAAGVFFALRTLPLNPLRKATEHAALLASHDPLTRLPNRALFNDWLVHSVADIEREAGSMAVLCLDLDRFKEVNDLYGHAAGDELLCQVTERASGTLRR